MNIAVLIKQVPDMEQVIFDHEKGCINRASAGTRINPFDINALEAALQIREKLGGRICAVSMGPPKAMETLRDAIAFGADQGILLSDKKFSGSDVKATAQTLTAALRKCGRFDLILAGIYSVDGDTGQVGPEVAQLLGIPHMNQVETIYSYTETSIEAAGSVWDSLYRKRAAYPVLMTVTKDVNQPRLICFKAKMKARKTEILQWSFEDLKEFLTEDQIGIRGSATRVKKIEIPPPIKREGRVWEQDYAEAFKEIFQLCVRTKVN